MIRLLLAVLPGILLSLYGYAQSYDSTLFENMNMRSIGPAGMSGRVTCVDVNMNDTKHILVGTASGGLWESKNAGTSWKPLFDSQATIAIGSVSFSQKNPDVIWVGTGEGNPRNSHTSGAGIYKSIDGGRTWKMMGLENTKTIHRLIVHPDNPDIVYAGAMGSIWGPNSERGLYKTINGGETWNKILYVNDSTGCADLIIDPSNPNKMLAAMWQYNREPWFFNSGGKGSGLHLTYDGGKTWKKLSDKNGLPKGILGRIGLTICHDKSNVVYALIESKKTALYRSNDGGENWYKVSDKNIGNRPFYYADIYVDPKNENRIYNLYSVVSMSEDGGKTFETILPYSSVHPDHHAFWINPGNPEHLIDGNDGGVNISMDGGTSWRFVENLPVGQFYHINYDMDVPYNIYGGMQDNGSWVGPSRVFHSGGIQNADWQEVLFGDGFDVMPKAGNSRYGYAMYQGGSIHTYDRITGQTQNIQPVPEDTVKLRFNWNAPMAQDPHNKCGIYFGSQFVHYSNDCGLSWKRLSPDLTTNDPDKQRQEESGGLTIDATKAENFTTIISIAPSPLNENVIWIGTDDGNLWVTRNGGEDWEKLNHRLTKYVPTGTWIPMIVASSHHEDEAFIVANDYRRNNWETYAVKAWKYGRKMESLVTPDIKGHTLSIAQDHIVEDLLFLGTEHGLYFSTDGGLNWNKWTSNYPAVPTIDLKIHPRDPDLIIGTFGRAAYILEDITPLRVIAKNKDFLEKDFEVLDAENAFLASYKTNPGMRFGADAHYRGENTGYGATFTYYLKEKPSKKDMPKDSTGKINWKKFTAHIIDPRGDTVRTFYRDIDTGFNRITWHLETDGFRFPGRRKSQKGEADPSGLAVVPGNYKMVGVYGTYKDTAMVTVLPDPREIFDFAGAKEKRKILRDFQRSIESATEAHDFLESAKREIKRVNGLAELIETDSIQSQIKKRGKNLLKIIDSLDNIVRLPSDFEGYDHVSIRLTNKIYQAYSLIISSQGKPGPNAMQAKKNAEIAIRKFRDAVNDFMKNEWKDYTTFVRKQKFELFEDYEKIRR